MKIKILGLLFLISSISFPWGKEGHKLIASKTFDLLKDKMMNVEIYKEYVIVHSIDPDLRKNLDNTEGPKHYIDIDFYPEFLDGKMINDKIQLSRLYGDSVVTKMGLLPWTTLETYKNLQKAFSEQNRDKILIYAADLAHYVADAHQPMHTLLNYDGQFTDQKGVHARYESIMLEKYIDELSSEIEGSKVEYVAEPLDFIFDYITNSNSLSEVLLSSDKFASKRAGSTDNEEYYSLLWFKTRYVTKIQFESAVNSLASLIFSAWTDAGTPSINEIN